MNQQPDESAQFYLNISNPLLEREETTLTSTERIAYRALIFAYDLDSGGLTGFFYNIAASHSIAEETAAALDTIGALEAASLLRSIARIICQPDNISQSETWDDFLETVDPKRQLDIYGDKIEELDEDFFGLLEAFTWQHREELSASRA